MIFKRNVRLNLNTSNWRNFLFLLNMGCCLLSRNTKPKIEIIDKIPDGQDFDYLRPGGRIFTVSIKFMMSLKLRLILTVGAWTVFVFGLKVKRSDLIFCCYRELLPFHFKFQVEVVIMIPFFSSDKNFLKNGFNKIFVSRFNSCWVNTKYLLLYGL